MHLPVLPEVDTSAFRNLLEDQGAYPLRGGPVTTLQINVGKRCNQACLHCHVDAGPQRTESMSDMVMERVLLLAEQAQGLQVIDITGGAPEMHPRFRDLIERARDLVPRLINRCNLTILSEPGYGELGRFLAQHRVDVVASLPCYGAANVDAQRGRGVFERSLHGLRSLNALGYGRPGSGLQLDLVYNPAGPFLPPAQAGLEADYREQLAKVDVRFNRLLTLTNMPIHRFARSLRREGRHSEYMALLQRSFNPATVAGLMCRSQVSVSYDGRIYDCDFNQMLDLPAEDAPSVFDVANLSELAGRAVRTDAHCLACTAGAGSSCGGELV